MEPKTSKRIVSRREYAKVRGKRSGLFFTALCLVFILMFFFIAALGMLFLPASFASWCLMFAIAFAILFAPILQCTLAIVNVARQLDPGVPLARVNVADLPAPDTLVRASSEPMQAQEAVLLRAATQGQETPSEQLVRASVGQE